jgi:hypothetical protein
MGRGVGVAKLSLGLLLSVLTLWNLQFGFYQMGSGQMRKLVLTMVFSGACSQASISGDLESAGQSDCLQAVGTWEPIEVILLLVGLRLTWSAMRSLFGSQRKATGAQRKANRVIRIGLLLAVVGIADLFGMLSTDGKPLQLGDLSGFPTDGPAIGVILLCFSTLCLIAGTSMKRTASADRMISIDGSEAGARRFLGPAERHLGKDFSVGELRRALRLDQFEDAFQISADDDEGMVVGRTCHYCSGEGCGQCGYSGSLD